MRRPKTEICEAPISRLVAISRALDKKEQHRRKQQVQGPFIAVSDISRDEGATLRIPEYKFIQSVYPDALQERRSVKLV